MSVVPQNVPRERVRGPEFTVLRTQANGIPFEKAVPLVDSLGLAMASNKRMTQALFQPTGWWKIRNAFVCYTGTHTAYIEPNTPFDEKSLLVVNELEKLAGTRYFVDHVDPETNKHWLYPVHPDYLGKQNSILVAEHPNYTLKEDGNRIITLPAGMSLREAVDLVGNFPAATGRYKGDPKYDIPIVSQRGSDRTLWRIAKNVGPTVRSFEGFLGSDGRWDVALSYQPSVDFGVVVEATKGSQPL